MSVLATWAAEKIARDVPSVTPPTSLRAECAAASLFAPSSESIGNLSERAKRLRKAESRREEGVCSRETAREDACGQSELLHHAQ